jgi:hypothetical protein
VRTLAAAVVAAALAVPAASADPGPLHIHKVTGKVVVLGKWSSLPLLGVQLHVTLCLRSHAEAMDSVPSEIRIAHYAVDKKTKHWWLARMSIDHAPWLVTFGETWGAHSACGDVQLEDVIPPDHYGVESLGNPNTCYGVGVTIKSGGRSASRRTIVTCHFAR